MFHFTEKVKKKNIYIHPEFHNMKAKRANKPYCTF